MNELAQKQRDFDFKGHLKKFNETKNHLKKSNFLYICYHLNLNIDDEKDMINL